MTLFVQRRFLDRLGLAVMLLAAIVPAGSSIARAASPKHGRHVGGWTHRAVASRSARRMVADRPWPGATTVYGASAPYYIYGKGGGDAYGDDPIGGPSRVGDGGPGYFGGGLPSLTDAQARRAAGWPGY